MGERKSLWLRLVGRVACAVAGRYESYDTPASKPVDGLSEAAAWRSGTYPDEKESEMFECVECGAAGRCGCVLDDFPSPWLPLCLVVVLLVVVVAVRLLLNAAGGVGF